MPIPIERNESEARVYLVTAEVARDLQKSEATVRAWRRLNIGPPSVVLGGRQVLYPRREYEMWKAEQLRKTRRGDRVAVS